MLTRIAGAVADGEAVDWDSAERVLPESHRVIARALRILVGIEEGLDPPQPALDGLEHRIEGELARFWIDRLAAALA